MVKERQDITGLSCIKGASGKVIVDDTHSYNAASRTQCRGMSTWRN